MNNKSGSDNTDKVFGQKTVKSERVGKRPRKIIEKSEMRDNDRKPYGKSPYSDRPTAGDRENRRPSRDDDRPAKSYGSGSRDNDRKPFGKPSYSDRPTAGDGENRRPSREDDRPAKSYGSSSRDNDRNKPTAGERENRRPSREDDRPAKSYGSSSRDNDRNKPTAGERENRRPSRDDNRPAKSFGKSSSNYRGRSKEDETGRDPFQKETIRLNKFLADAGICSRREADTLIAAGTVTVNGVVVTELGTKVSIHDKVNYGGQTLRREKLRYVLLNKPKGYITTTDDPEDRKTVMELVTSACSERIYPVGRLDRNTLGLLLLTNDGDLAKKLMHPQHGVTKLYHVELDKPLTKNDLLQIAAGLELEDGKAVVDGISYVEGNESKKEVGIEIHIGKNRIVRRIFEHLNYNVVKLDRVTYAGLTKLNLTRSRWRHLTPQEVSMLKRIK
jgi:23S rRNA pseudouridine2605 synthase